ncbi:hypothetical protein ON010_g16157 [Phytophthora cinnamomi]|nr:hypothetical protein ON010_g16157 [Phytophthora cinnamomi]
MFGDYGRCPSETGVFTAVNVGVLRRQVNDVAEDSLTHAIAYFVHFLFGGKHKASTVLDSNDAPPSADKLDALSLLTVYDHDGEERSGLSVPVAEKVKTFFSSPKVTQDHLQRWLGKGKSAGCSTLTTSLVGSSTSTICIPRTPRRERPRSQHSLFTMATVDETTKITRTKELATELQTKQMNHWVAVAKDPDDVFHFMELDKVNEHILSNPKFTAWANGKSPGGAFVKLGLGEPVSNLLERPLFSNWLKYTNAYSVKYPHEKATAIETLTQKFGDKQVAQMLDMAKSKDAPQSIAINLESAQLEMWFSGEKSVNDVRVLLRLYSVGDFGGDSLLNTWVSYMNVFLKDNPGEVTSILTKLETQFSDRPFHQILQAIVKFSSMESAATKIQAEKIQALKDLPHLKDTSLQRRGGAVPAEARALLRHLQFRRPHLGQAGGGLTLQGQGPEAPDAAGAGRLREQPRRPEDLHGDAHARHHGHGVGQHLPRAAPADGGLRPGGGRARAGSLVATPSSGGQEVRGPEVLPGRHRPVRQRGPARAGLPQDHPAPHLRQVYVAPVLHPQGHQQRVLPVRVRDGEAQRRRRAPGDPGQYHQRLRHAAQGRALAVPRARACAAAQAQVRVNVPPAAFLLHHAVRRKGPGDSSAHYSGHHQVLAVVVLVQAGHLPERAGGDSGAYGQRAVAAASTSRFRSGRYSCGTTSTS